MKPRKTALLLAGALLPLASLAFTSPASSHPCLVPGEQRTIEVKVKVLDKVVKRGDTVRVDVRTYRPAQKDVLGTGVDSPVETPMEPTEEMMLTVGVLTGDERVAQNVASKTDSKGHRVVKVKLKTYHYPGPADVRVHAYADYFSEQPVGTCVEVQEGGFTEIVNAFTVG